VVWTNRSSPAPSSVLSFTASASSATICSASRLIDLMRSSAQSVTKAELSQLIQAFRNHQIARYSPFLLFL
jgi:hypothetical protein